jgi:NADH dehydrogenase FAD-containing subunit
MSTPRLLLLGSSPAHLLVLEALARQRLPETDVVLIAPEPVQLFAGMVPGFIEGRYRLDEVGIDLRKLCVTARSRLVPGRATRIDPSSKTVSLQDGSAFTYDIASVALAGGEGGATAHAQSAGTVERVAALAAALDALAAEPRPEPRRVVVIGASEMGIELALSVRARLDKGQASDVIISVLDGRSELFGGRLPAWSNLVERVLAQHDITLRLGTGAAEVGADFVRLSDGRVHPTDVAVWAPVPHAEALFRDSGLPVDGHGLLQLDDTLQVQGIPELFGAGGGTSMISAPRAPASEASSLRMGEVLVPNLAVALAGGDPTRRYRPRDRDLTLLNAGDGRALLFYGPVATASGWAMRLKQWMDRRFMGRFRGSGDGTGTTAGS